MEIGLKMIYTVHVLYIYREVFASKGRVKQIEKTLLRSIFKVTYESEQGVYSVPSSELVKGASGANSDDWRESLALYLYSVVLCDLFCTE